MCAQKVRMDSSSRS